MEFSQIVLGIWEKNLKVWSTEMILSEKLILPSGADGGRCDV